MDATMKIFARILLLASFIVAGVLLAHAQQPSQNSQAQNSPAKAAAQKPAPPKPFVWTDDNIDNVRSAADDYQVEQAKEKAAEQAAAKQAAAQKAAAAAKNEQKNLWPVPKVTSVQQANQDIAQKSRDLTAEQDYVQQLQKRLANTDPSGTEKMRLEWRLKSHSMTVQHLQNQVKDLEKQKAALEKQSQSGSKPNSASTPQSQ